MHTYVPRVTEHTQLLTADPDAAITLCVHFLGQAVCGTHPHTHVNTRTALTGGTHPTLQTHLETRNECSPTLLWAAVPTCGLSAPAPHTVHTHAHPARVAHALAHMQALCHPTALASSVQPLPLCTRIRGDPHPSAAPPLNTSRARTHTRPPPLPQPAHRRCTVAHKRPPSSVHTQTRTHTRIPPHISFAHTRTHARTPPAAYRLGARIPPAARGGSGAPRPRGPRGGAGRLRLLRPPPATKGRPARPTPPPRGSTPPAAPPPSARAGFGDRRGGSPGGGVCRSGGVSVRRCRRPRTVLLPPQCCVRAAGNGERFCGRFQGGAALGQPQGQRCWRCMAGARIAGMCVWPRALP